MKFNNINSQNFQSQAVPEASEIKVNDISLEPIPFGWARASYAITLKKKHSRHFYSIFSKGSIKCWWRLWGTCINAKSKRGNG